MKNIKGLKFNRLTAVEYLGRNKFHHNVWLFQCECNTERDEQNHKEKGFFISILKANLTQLEYFMKKANKDYEGVEKRKTKIEERQGQISLLINEKNEIVGVDVPEIVKAMNE